jgi:cell division topological specificity factor
MAENSRFSFSKISKIFGKKQTPKDRACERLKLVLIHDRANVKSASSDFLKTIKDEIMKVLLKYMDIGEEALDIHITSTESEDGTRQIPALTANIPIRNLRA